MAQLKVAVIGAGSSGLSILKTLREDGFNVTCFERRSRVGGLWSYSDDPKVTSALQETCANISKFTCGMSDFPMPDKYPHYLTQPDFQEYMESYASHFDLHKDIVFKSELKNVIRNKENEKWLLKLLVDGKERNEEFDKVAFCHGYQTKAKIPQFAGLENFKGEVIHGQAFCRPESYKRKRVVILGVSASASDLTKVLIPVASKVYLSHRRGAMLIPQYRNGYPPDLLVNWRRRQIAIGLQRSFPNLARWLVDKFLAISTKKLYGELDPKWRLDQLPSPVLAPRALSDSILPFLKDGSLESVYGIKQFLGPGSIELDDGTILDDVDAVICATGYTADFSVSPFLKTSRPRNYGGPDIVRLWKNLFPPEYADSIVMLCYSAFGKNNGFSFSDVASMAVSNIWRGIHSIPPVGVMEREINNHHEWVASRWRMDNTVDVSMCKIWEYQGFLHEAAGTGMEHLGWGWKGWKFFFQDPKMSYLMNHGVETAHAFRYFETGKRRAWSGAREAIIHMNDLVKEFPVKQEKVA